MALPALPELAVLAYTGTATALILHKAERATSRKRIRILYALTGSILLIAISVIASMSIPHDTLPMALSRALLTQLALYVGLALYLTAKLIVQRARGHRTPSRRPVRAAIREEALTPELLRPRDA